MSQPISDVKIDLIVDTSPIKTIQVGEVTNQPVAFDIGEVPNLISNGLPTDGATGTHLAKRSDNDYDTQWVTPHEVPAGGTGGQVLGKKSGTDYDTQWTNLPSMPLYDECGSASDWAYGSGPGTWSVVSVADSQAGGKVVQMVGHSILTRSSSLIPYDPTALYRVKCRVRQSVDGAPNTVFYLGLAGVAADGVSLVNVSGTNTVGNQHYVAPGTTITVAQGWQEFLGYMKGVAATGTTSVVTTPLAPGQMHQNTRYVRPILQANATAGVGTAQVDYVTVEIVPEPAYAQMTPLYDDCGTAADWLNLSGSGTWSVATVTDSAAGGKVLRSVGATALHRVGSLVPFDPGALYQIKCRVRQTVDFTAGNSTVQVGLTGIASDGVTVVSTAGTNSVSATVQHNVCVNGTQLTVAQGWKEFVGYVRGVAATGSSGPNLIATVPGQMHSSTRYIRPFVSVNYQGNGTAEIDYVSLEIVPEPEQPLPIYDEGNSLTPWYQYSGSGSASVAQVADSSVGGKVIAVAGWAAQTRMPLVPYDPNALYRMKVRARRTVNPGTGSNTIYAGLEGVAADGVTIVSYDGSTTRTTAHWVVVSGTSLLVAGGWQEFTGYAKGVAATGTVAACPSPAAPGVLHQNVRYVRPTITINSGDGTARAEVDYVSLEIVPPTAIASSAEITLSGDGAGTPLSAALTGTVSGKDWKVPTGVIESGSSGGSYNGILQTLQTIGGAAYVMRSFMQGSAAPVIATWQLLKNAANTMWFGIGEDGQISTCVGSQVRPIPFATSAGQASLTLGTAAVSASVVVTFPTGRFTQVPILVGSSSTNTLLGLATSATTTQFTAWLRHVDNTAWSGTYYVNWIAMQMTPTSTPGGAPAMAREEGPTHTSTCRTEGCENQDISITGEFPEGCLGVVCGACGQPITDTATS